jgi:hypothetical protein
MRLDPIAPDPNRPPFGIRWQQWRQLGRLALFIAGISAIVIVTLIGLTAKKPWLWTWLSQMNVVGGLIKRRAELAGEIERTHETLRKMVLDLENLDATILQCEPDFRVEAIRPKAFRRRIEATGGGSHD